ncbi:MAG TPA: type II toxin-antitoxin system Phd/YefM family antitoxin [Isosphaeraceae bacterium]|nr:type II toxin-antitoxin system Phd/YefM family antitoxin [Isosphaeraceae bacterium]
MNLNRDIHPLTDFKRNTTQFLAQLKQTGHPVVLTINGKAEIVVQDAKSYQRLLDLAERLETIQAVKEGLASMNRGDGRPMDEVFDELEKALRARADA